MRCQSPGCTGEHQPQTISHSVIHRERTLVIHGVPADVCPDCGEVLVAEETILHIDHLLARKARSKDAALLYEV
ncbi:MAG TPA: YgiT-type zinc finger protein [Thermoanaerobaculia bacterium]|nr:YgiT-type zinc finger protein [Thermoanaerobaculia bacterium]